MKFSFGKTFLLGIGFFGVSVIWSVYNAYVPIFLEERFLVAAGFIGIFMTLDNIAALFIQPPVGAWSDRLRTPIGRRMPFILIGAPFSRDLICHPSDNFQSCTFLFCCHFTFIEHGYLANSCCCFDARYHSIQISFPG